ncbi:MAG: hypothetical protein VX559_09435, partial [Pseudomonadota bacterium]|nr:hypothetical protein [Pseudomonadota bacterium]
FFANFYLFHHYFPLIDTLASISRPVKPVIQKNHGFIADRALLTTANSTSAIHRYRSADTSCQSVGVV